MFMKSWAIFFVANKYFRCLLAVSSSVFSEDLLFSCIIKYVEDASEIQRLVDQEW